MRPSNHHANGAGAPAAGSGAFSGAVVASRPPHVSLSSCYYSLAAFHFDPLTKASHRVVLTFAPRTRSLVLSTLATPRLSFPFAAFRACSFSASPDVMLSGSATSASITAHSLTLTLAAATNTGAKATTPTQTLSLAFATAAVASRVATTINKLISVFASPDYANASSADAVTAALGRAAVPAATLLEGSVLLGNQITATTFITINNVAADGAHGGAISRRSSEVSGQIDDADGGKRGLGGGWTEKYLILTQDRLFVFTTTPAASSTNQGNIHGGSSVVVPIEAFSLTSIVGMAATATNTTLPTLPRFDTITQSHTAAADGDDADADGGAIHGHSGSGGAGAGGMTGGRTKTTTTTITTPGKGAVTTKTTVIIPGSKGSNGAGDRAQHELNSNQAPQMALLSTDLSTPLVFLFPSHDACRQWCAAVTAAVAAAKTARDAARAKKSGREREKAIRGEAVVRAAADAADGKTVPGGVLSPSKGGLRGDMGVGAGAAGAAGVAGTIAITIDSFGPEPDADYDSAHARSGDCGDGGGGGYTVPMPPAEYDWGHYPPPITPLLALNRAANSNSRSSVVGSLSAAARSVVLAPYRGSCDAAPYVPATLTPSQHNTALFTTDGNGSVSGSGPNPSSVGAGVFAAGALALASGLAHHAALLPNGSLHLWGSNSAGQLGSGPSPLYAPAPLALTPLHALHVAMVACGASHTVALAFPSNPSHSNRHGHGNGAMDGGAVFVWGSNARGQLGLGPAARVPLSATPRRLALLPPVRYIAAGGDASAALTVSGRGYAWGADAAECGLFLLDPEQSLQLSVGANGGDASSASQTASAAGNAVSVAVVGEYDDGDSNGGDAKSSRVVATQVPRAGTLASASSLSSASLQQQKPPQCDPRLTFPRHCAPLDGPLVQLALDPPSGCALALYAPNPSPAMRFFPSLRYAARFLAPGASAGASGVFHALVERASATARLQRLQQRQQAQQDLEDDEDEDGAVRGCESVNLDYAESGGGDDDDDDDDDDDFGASSRNYLGRPKSSKGYLDPLFVPSGIAYDCAQLAALAPTAIALVGAVAAVTDNGGELYFAPPTHAAAAAAASGSSSSANAAIAAAVAAANPPPPLAASAVASVGVSSNAAGASGASADAAASAAAAARTAVQQSETRANTLGILSQPLLFGNAFGGDAAENKSKSAFNIKFTTENKADGAPVSPSQAARNANGDYNIAATKTTAAVVRKQKQAAESVEVQSLLSSAPRIPPVAIFSEPRLASVTGGALTVVSLSPAPVSVSAPISTASASSDAASAATLGDCGFVASTVSGDVWHFSVNSNSSAGAGAFKPAAVHVSFASPVTALALISPAPYHSSASTAASSGASATSPACLLALSTVPLAPTAPPAALTSAGSAFAAAASSASGSAAAGSAFAAKAGPGRAAPSRGAPARSSPQVPSVLSKYLDNPGNLPLASQVHSGCTGSGNGSARASIFAPIAHHNDSDAAQAPPATVNLGGASSGAAAPRRPAPSGAGGAGGGDALAGLAGGAVADSSAAVALQAMMRNMALASNGGGGGGRGVDVGAALAAASAVLNAHTGATDAALLVKAPAKQAPRRPPTAAHAGAASSSSAGSGFGAGASASGNVSSHGSGAVALVGLSSHAAGGRAATAGAGLGVNVSSPGGAHQGGASASHNDVGLTPKSNALHGMYKGGFVPAPNAVRIANHTNANSTTTAHANSHAHAGESRGGGGGGKARTAAAGRSVSFAAGVGADADDRDDDGHGYGAYDDDAEAPPPPPPPPQPFTPSANSQASRFYASQLSPQSALSPPPPPPPLSTTPPPPPPPMSALSPYATADADADVYAEAALSPPPPPPPAEVDGGPIAGGFSYGFTPGAGAGLRKTGRLNFEATTSAASLPPPPTPTKAAGADAGGAFIAPVSRSAAKAALAASNANSDASSSTAKFAQNAANNKAVGARAIGNSGATGPISAGAGAAAGGGGSAGIAAAVRARFGGGGSNATVTSHADGDDDDDWNALPPPAAAKSPIAKPAAASKPVASSGGNAFSHFFAGVPPVSAPVTAPASATNNNSSSNNAKPAPAPATPVAAPVSSFKAPSRPPTTTSGGLISNTGGLSFTQSNKAAVLPPRPSVASTSSSGSSSSSAAPAPAAAGGSGFFNPHYNKSPGSSSSSSSSSSGSGGAKGAGAVALSPAASASAAHRARAAAAAAAAAAQDDDDDDDPDLWELPPP